MLVFIVIVRESFDGGHFELFNFKQLRSAFLSGIKPCDVITHKVNPCFILCTLHTCKIIWNMQGIVHLLSIFKIHVFIGGNCTSATFSFCDLLVAGWLHMNRFGVEWVQLLSRHVLVTTTCLTCGSDTKIHLSSIIHISTSNYVNIVYKLY